MESESAPYTKRKQHEFTPIGYLKEKTQRTNIVASPLKENHVNKRQKLDTDDDRNASSVYMLFREDEEPNNADDDFEDFENPDIALKPKRKNLLSDLESKNSSQQVVSEPLKDNQKILDELTKENLTLKFKIAGLHNYYKILQQNSNTDSNFDREQYLVQKLSETEAQLHQINTKYQQLSENSETSDDVETLRLENTQLQEKLDSLERLKDQYEADLKESTTGQATLQKALKTLKKELQTHLDLQQNLKSQLDNISSEKADLEAQVESMKKEDTHEVLVDELKSLEKQNKQLQDKISNNEKDKLGLSKKIQDLQLQLGNLETEKNTNLNNFEESTNRYKILLNEKEKLQETLATVEKQRLDSKKTISDLKSEIDSLQKELHDIKQKVTTTQVENDEISLLKAELENKKAKIKSDQDLIKSLKTKISQSTADSLDLKHLQNELDSKQQELEQKQREIDSVQQELKIKQKEVETKKQELKSKQQDLEIKQQELDDKEKELATLRAKLSDSKEHEDSRLRDLQEEMASLQAHYKKTLSSETSQYKSKLDRLQKDNEELLHRIEHSEHMEKILQEKNTMLSRDNDLKQTDLETMRSDNVKILAQLSKTREENSKLEKEIRSKTADLQELQNRHKILELEMLHNDKEDNSNDKIERYKKLLTNAKDYAKFLQKRAQALEDENVALNSKIKDLNGEQEFRQLNLETNREQAQIAQDKIDYYRMKYHNEVNQNNSLRVIGDYQNRVLKAISQLSDSNLLKMKRELAASKYSTFEIGPFADYDFLGRPSSSSKDYLSKDYNEYDYNDGLYRQRPRGYFYSRKFKRAAIVVLACIRMKHVASKSRRNRRILEDLEKRIYLNEDRITW